MITLLAVLLLQIVAFVSANTEKTIFLAPPQVPNLHTVQPNLYDLHLPTLTPGNSSLRTQLAVQFPTDTQASGQDHWLLLGDLNPGQRYELRICWVATQPTAFTLKTLEINTVLSQAELIGSLADYSEGRLAALAASGETQVRRGIDSIHPESLLLVHVSAAADFYSSDKTLMQSPPPVHVDIILDPYIFNVFPRSLIPTAAYIIVIAICGWFVSSATWNWLSTLKEPQAKKHAE